MKLTIYKDKYFREAREVREVAQIAVPYRTAEAVAELLADLDLENITDQQALRLVLKNFKHVTAVVQATFAVADEDLPFIKTNELLELGKELVGYVLKNLVTLGGEGDEDPNA